MAGFGAVQAPLPQASPATTSTAPSRAPSTSPVPRHDHVHRPGSGAAKRTANSAPPSQNAGRRSTRPDSCAKSAHSSTPV